MANISQCNIFIQITGNNYQIGHILFLAQIVII